MQISYNDWQNFRKKLSAIDKKAEEEMASWLQNKGGLIQLPRNEIIDRAYALATKYGEASASLSALMYDSIAELSGVRVPPAEVADTVEYGEMAKAVNGILKNEKSDKVLAQSVGKYTKRAGADTMLKNANRDGAEFAWVPGGDGCAFCEMLASRGWQHQSKAAMEGDHAEHIHANCDCSYTVRFDKNTNVKGYDPEKYLKKYYDAEGDTPQEKLNSMRRIHYQENKDKINAQKRARYAEKINKKENSIVIRLGNKYYMNYGTIENGEANTIDAGGSNKDKVISCIKVGFENTSVFISERIYESSERIMDIIEPYLIEGLDAVGREHGTIPTFVIADVTELTDPNGRNVMGRYLYDSNTVILVPKLFEESEKSDEYNAHLTFHELLHWSDCQEIGKRHPGLKEEKLVPIIRKESKKSIDKLGINEYNVNEISGYATDSFELKNYDEVYVEYRVKELMEKRDK